MFLCETNRNRPMTPAEAKQRLRLRGETIASWADRHGFPRADVYAALSGRTVGNFGTAHRIAVALGMKPSLAGAEPADARKERIQR